MSFQTRAQVPVANDTGNILESQAIGNKTDTAVVAVGTDKSLMAYAKGILTTVLGISGAQTEVQVYGPSSVDIDNVGHFEACIVDKDVGLIASASITAGTYTLKRIRAGVSSDIAVGSAWSKANGRVYADITFATANWDQDDAFVVVPLGDTTYAVGATTYYPAIPTISGIISDLATIEGKVDAVQADIGNPSARANDSSIEDMLGVPDVAGKDLYTCLVTDRLDSATFGLSALNTDIDAIATDVGNASAGTLGSLYAVLGNPTSAISSVVGTNLVLAVGAGSAAADQPINAMVRWIVDNTALASVLGVPVGASISADIADVEGKVDDVEGNIGSPLKSGAASTLSLILGDPAGTDISTLVTDIEATIGNISNTTLADTLAATLGDFQNQTMVSRFDEIQGKVDGVPTISSYSYTDAGGEQDVLSLTPGAGEVWEIGNIFLDLVNMTQNGTIKLYIKVDGTNYREISSTPFAVATDSDGIWVDFRGMISDDFKITYTEGADEGAARSIPYQVNYIIR